LHYRVNGVATTSIIPPGNYSLVSLNEAIVNVMNTAFPNHFKSSPSVRENKIGIEGLTSDTFEILTDSQLASAGFTTTADELREAKASALPYSVNNVLRNFTPEVVSSLSNFVWTSGYVDLMPITNLYIVSSGLGSFNTMSVSGERSIVKKVPVNAGYGEMIYDQSLVGIDYLDCSHQTLSRLSFQLKDVFGNVIDLHGQHWSFSIVFSRVNEIMN